MDKIAKILKKNPSKQTVPNSLEGKVTKNSILDEFKNCYEELYNSAGSGQQMELIKSSLSLSISQDSYYEVSKVTSSIVKQACSKMKTGKNDVTGAFSSDVLSNGPDLLYELLASVFRGYLVHGSITDQVLSCAFLPLFKGGFKNPDKFDSYRAIASSSLVLKLFEYVLLILWGDQLSTDSLQFGFNPLGPKTFLQC